MSQERNSLKAGIFIMLSIALMIAIVIGIKGVGQFLEPMQNVTVKFRLADDIGGLSAGDEVRVGGAKVGLVKTVELIDKAEQHEIVVQCAIPKRFELHKDAVVAIQSTVTGVSVLNFSALGTGPALAGDSLAGRPGALTSLLESGPDIMALVSYIRKVTVPKVNLVLEKAGETVETYKQTGVAATELIGQVRSKVDPIVERYSALADSYRGVADGAKITVGHLNDIFGDTKTDIRATMANLHEITGTINQRLPGLVDKVDGGLTNIMAAVTNINQVLDDVKQIAANTRDFTGSARTLLTTNRSKIDNMIIALKTTADNLKGASAEVRRSPWRLLYQPSADEMNNLNLYDTTRQFAEGANDLNDAASALRDALKDPASDKAELAKLAEKLDKSFANFNDVEQQLWVKIKQ